MSGLLHCFAVATIKYFSPKNIKKGTVYKTPAFAVQIRHFPIQNLFFTNTGKIKKPPQKGQSQVN